ncbi:MAG: AAA family ATPase, partial [Planctomycetota bacterium]
MNPSEVEAGRALLVRLREGLGQVLFGQDELLDLTVIALAARGNLLIEGMPGLGKTELVKALGQLLGLDFRRIQFTPDLLPSDITGGPVLEEKDGTRQFVFREGPLFAHLVLADEINRASPKTQSALLEAMQERRVTVLGETHTLPEPFFVLATQP